MSKENIKKFIDFLELNKLSRVTPHAYTQGELVAFANLQGFNFSINELNDQLKLINQTPEEQLIGLVKSWKNNKEIL